MYVAQTLRISVRHTKSSHCAGQENEEEHVSEIGHNHSICGWQWQKTIQRLRYFEVQPNIPTLLWQGSC